jgi:Flp pilus assembly protein TadB
MAHALIPVYEPGDTTQIETGVGQFSVGAAAVQAVATLAAVGVTSFVQLKMAKDDREAAENLANKQSARADALAKQAREDQMRAEADLAAANAAAASTSASGAVTTRKVLLGGGVALGVAAVVAVVAYLVLRK